MLLEEIINKIEDEELIRDYVEGLNQLQTVFYSNFNESFFGRYRSPGMILYEMYLDHNTTNNDWVAFKNWRTILGKCSASSSDSDNKRKENIYTLNYYDQALCYGGYVLLDALIEIHERSSQSITNETWRKDKMSLLKKPLSARIDNEIAIIKYQSYKIDEYETKQTNGKKALADWLQDQHRYNVYDFYHAYETAINCINIHREDTLKAFKVYHFKPWKEWNEQFIISEDIENA